MNVGSNSAGYIKASHYRPPCQYPFHCLDGVLAAADAATKLEQRTIGLPPVVLTPRHLASIAGEVNADAVMLADLGAAKAGEVAFRLVGACVLIGERESCD